MNARDIQTTYERGARNLFGQQRGDEHLVHVSDLKSCNIATRARLLGRPFLRPTVAKLLQFSLGLAAEDFMATSIQDGLADDGWAIERDVLMYMQWSHDSCWAGKLRRATYPATLIADDTGGALDPIETIVGHADLIARRANEVVVLEAKSTARIAPDNVPWDYAIQSQAYALMARFIIPAAASNAQSIIVGVMDRRSGDYRLYDVDSPLAKLDELRQLSMSALDTFTFDPPADYDPPLAWMCKTCDFADCARNVNPERYSLQEV